MAPLLGDAHPRATGYRPPAKTLAPCGDPVPDEVLGVLRDAYGEDAGRIGSVTRGHEADACVCRSLPGQCSGACLAYGELLPAGCSRALRRLGLAAGGGEAGGGRSLLELGMGTGKVALQAFVECPGVSRVIGVELSGPRFALAVDGLRRLVDARPAEFSLEVEEAEEPDLPGASVEANAGSRPPDGVAARRCRLSTQGGAAAPRVLELRRGDFLLESVVSDDEYREANVILLQLCLPPDALARVKKRISLAQDGCRLFILSDLRAKRRLKEASQWRPWRQGDGPVPEGEEVCEDKYATTWAATYGMTFYTFCADRQYSGCTAGQKPPGGQAVREARAGARRL